MDSLPGYHNLTARRIVTQSNHRTKQNIGSGFPGRITGITRRIFRCCLDFVIILDALCSRVISQAGFRGGIHQFIAAIGFGAAINLVCNSTIYGLPGHDNLTGGCIVTQGNLRTTQDIGFRFFCGICRIRFGVFRHRLYLIRIGHTGYDLSIRNLRIGIGNQQAPIALILTTIYLVLNGTHYFFPGHGDLTAACGAAEGNNGTGKIADLIHDRRQGGMSRCVLRQSLYLVVVGLTGHRRGIHQIGIGGGSHQIVNTIAGIAAVHPILDCILHGAPGQADLAGNFGIAYGNDLRTSQIASSALGRGEHGISAGVLSNCPDLIVVGLTGFCGAVQNFDFGGGCQQVPCAVILRPMNLIPHGSCNGIPGHPDFTAVKIVAEGNDRPRQGISLTRPRCF